MSQYINTVKDLFNILIVVGATITLKDYIIYMIGRLDFNYNSLITTLTHKKKIPSLEKVFTMMHVYEQVQRMSLVTLALNIIQENFARSSMSLPSNISSQVIISVH